MTNGGPAAPRRFSLGVPLKIALLTGGIAAWSAEVDPSVPTY